MDPIKLEKYQAMRTHNRCNNFLSSLTLYSLLVVMFGLLLWLPTLCSSIKLFLIESLPKIIDIVLGPKCVFLVFHLIIIFLVSESRLSRSSLKPDIYEEYVIHNQGLKGVSSIEGKGNEGALVCPLVEEGKGNEGALVCPLVEDKKEIEKEEEKKEIEKEEEKEEEEEEEEEVMQGESEVLEEEEERALPAEELNKRVEDFIAMVNMQRRLEARMVVCCG